MAWQRQPHDEGEQSSSSSGAFWLLIGLVVVVVVVLLVGFCGVVFAVRSFSPPGPGRVRPPMVVTPAYNPTAAAAMATATAASQP